MRVERRSDVESETFRFRPRQPAGELFDRECVAINSRNDAVDLMPLQADPVPTRNQGKRGIEIAAQLSGVAGAAGVIPRDEAAARERMAGLLESLHIIALPGVDRERNCRELAYRLFGIDSVFGVTLSGQTVILFCAFHDVSSCPVRVAGGIFYTITCVFPERNGWKRGICICL